MKKPKRHESKPKYMINPSDIDSFTTRQRDFSNKYRPESNILMANNS